MGRPTNCPVYAGYCSEHGFTHGAEAEELREGIEKLIKDFDHPDEESVLQEVVRDLQALLDRVDARDSLAFSECPKKRRKARKRVTTPDQSKGEP